MLEYRIALAFGRLLSFLPFPLLYRISNFLAWLLEHVFKYKAAVISGNLKMAFPAKTTAQRQTIKSDFYRNFADIIVESFKSLSVSESEMRKRFVLRNPQVFEALQKENKGLIMVMGHHTNFEWTAMCTPLMCKQDCFAVYHPLKNQRFSRKIVQIREQFGLQLFKMKETYPFMLNNPSPAPLYVFMADQSPHKGKIKYRTPFLNQNTPVHLGVENLAKKCDLAVVFINIHRVKRGFYEVEAELLFKDALNTAPYEITKRHVKALEDLIISDPANWLWSHKRWKNV
jgi:KDO2-lipid IV(A) lauroyltransferase